MYIIVYMYYVCICTHSVSVCEHVCVCVHVQSVDENRILLSWPNSMICPRRNGVNSDLMARDVRSHPHH